MAFKPIPIFRMAKCRKCPRHCRPCLTLQEAADVQEAQRKASDNGEAWKAQTVCDACHQKSNDSQNKRTFKQAGRDFNDYGLTESELLEREIARLQAELDEVLSMGASNEV
jgi:cytochrome c553